MALERAMEFIEIVGVFMLATALQLPFHLAIASPWLLLAWICGLVLRPYVSPKIRIILTSGMASIGIAPAYGFHLSMVPVYSLVISGHKSLRDSAVPILATWLMLTMVRLIWLWVSGKRPPPPSNSPSDTDAQARRST